jgi:hypothetical protein
MRAGPKTFNTLRRWRVVQHIRLDRDGHTIWGKRNAHPGKQHKAGARHPSGQKAGRGGLPAQVANIALDLSACWEIGDDALRWRKRAVQEVRPWLTFDAQAALLVSLGRAGGNSRNRGAESVQRTA